MLLEASPLALVGAASKLARSGMGLATSDVIDDQVASRLSVVGNLRSRERLMVGTCGFSGSGRPANLASRAILAFSPANHRNQLSSTSSNDGV